MKIKKQVADAINEEIVKSGRSLANAQLLLRAHSPALTRKEVVDVVTEKPEPVKKLSKKSAKKLNEAQFLRAFARDAKERAAEGFDEAISVAQANDLLREIGRQPVKRGLSAEARALFKKYGIKIKK
jgi:hypothetical protein